MPSGQPVEKKLISRRAQGKHILEIYQCGPFIECTMDDIFIGKVRQKQQVLAPAKCDLEECLRLPHYIILLTDDEVSAINGAFVFKK